MRQLIAVTCGLIFLVSGAPLAFADTMSVPNLRMRTPALSMSQYILGPACISMRASPNELDCNPAFLADEDKHQLRLSIAGNDQLKDINDYRQRLSAGDSVGIADSILKRTDPIMAEATTALWYQRRWWSVGYVPFRGGLASQVQNPAYPTISADLYGESEVFAKVGLVASEDKGLQAGLQARYVDRQFFRKQFDLLDAVGDPNQIAVKKQKVLYLEPGVSYSFAHGSEAAWASSVSAMLSQLPVYQDGAQEEVRPVFDVGFSTTPPFAGGRFRTTTHFNNNPDLPDLFDRFLWGGIYDFDSTASISASLGRASAALGVQGHLNSVILGVGWRREQLTIDQAGAKRVSSFLFEGGLIF